jgi:MoaA/NifB/PqqE/SkfB family radical SAM enzyme
MNANNPNVSALLKELSGLTESGIAFDDFLKKVDIFNRTSIRQLAESYGSERHAKAVLLKLSNIAVGKYQYLHRHSRLIARPFGLIVDPSNYCHLACPGCIHRKTDSDKSNIDWVAGSLKQNTLDRLLDEFGSYAINTQYFNWGEPLLNKNTPQFIQASRRFLMRTSVSTNLSIPFDAEVLVASGLDYLVMSIDGATAATYGKYRIGGNFELVISNIRRLVEARKKLESSTPFIVWQYLLFDHTISEMDQAEKLGQQLGVDRINFAAPYDVSEHDATITKPAKPPVHHHVFNAQDGAARQSIANAVADLHPFIDDHWEKSWFSKMDGDYLDRPDTETCQWLYKNMVIDATGRILPCCFDPMKNPTSIFGDIRSGSDIFNTKHFVNSREYFSAPGTSFLNTACTLCPYNKSIPNINNNHLAAYLRFADTRACIHGDALNAICDWRD